MKTSKSLGLLSLVGALALAACGDEGPFAPTQEVSLDLEDRIALELTEDGESIETALATVELDLAAGARLGIDAGRRATAADLADRARSRFQTARAAAQAGERTRAVAEAREARRLVARAAAAARGPRMANAFAERIEDLRARVSDDPDDYDDAASLALELGILADAAHRAMAAGDSVRAGGLGVLAEQRHRHRVRRQDDPVERDVRARLAVELAGSAVGLAARLLDERDATDEQLRFLAAAREYLAAAERALEAGAPRRAVHLAGQAHWSALKAVVLPGGVTPDEARAMDELAKGLYEEAAAALGDAPTALQARILAHARAQITHGEALLAEGNVRGVAPLWRAAVACSWLLGQ